MDQTLPLNKLIILYMLDLVDFPLTNSQISAFILKQGYTTYFPLQQAFIKLEEDGLLTVEKVRNTSYYHLTEAGRFTLESFEHMISHPLKSEIKQYLVDNRYDLRAAVSTRSFYERTADGEYLVHCIVKERHYDIINVTLRVPIESLAISICDNWGKKQQDVYQFLMNNLLTEE